MLSITLGIARIACDYTVEEVAIFLGLSTNETKELEFDSSQISHGLLDKIQSLYGISLDNIFIGLASECVNRNRMLSRVTKE